VGEQHRLLEASQASTSRPSDKNRMTVKMLEVKGLRIFVFLITVELYILDKQYAAL
jgi:hypothetical protein